MKDKGRKITGCDLSQNRSWPLVSIGMPVYNEERFLEESLKSLLAQDYKNIEIIISDNASTDRTGQICKKHESKNGNISYHRFEKNCGVTRNFIEVLDLSRGRYFMWASGHDMWSENLISECVKLLEKHTSAVIAFGCLKWIGRRGNTIERFSGWTDTRGMDPIARYFSVFWSNVHPILGLMRTESLKKTRTLSIPGSDLIELTELVLLGDFVHATAAFCSRRELRGHETFTQRMKRYKGSNSGLASSAPEKLFPLIKLPIELVKSILWSKILWSEKFGIICALLPALVVKYISNRARQS